MILAEQFKTVDSQELKDLLHKLQTEGFGSGGSTGPRRPKMRAITEELKSRGIELVIVGNKLEWNK